MPSLTYTRDIPNPPNSPSVDVPNMKVNTNSIDDIWQADHFSFSASNPGTHKQATFTNESAPSLPAGTNAALFSNDVNSDGNGWPRWINALGNTVLINAIPSRNQNGYTSLAGKILLQWGIVNQSFSSGSTTGTTNFNTPFISGSYVVLATPLVSFATLPSSQASINIRTSSLGGTASFDWQFYTNSSQYKGFVWVAIGV